MTWLALLESPSKSQLLEVAENILFPHELRPCLSYCACSSSVVGGELRFLSLYKILIDRHAAILPIARWHHSYHDGKASREKEKKDALLLLFNIQRHNGHSVLLYHQARSPIGKEGEREKRCQKSLLPKIRADAHHVSGLWN